MTLYALRFEKYQRQAEIMAKNISARIINTEETKKLPKIYNFRQFFRVFTEYPKLDNWVAFHATTSF